MNFEQIYTELRKHGTEQNQKIYKDRGAKGDFFGVSLIDLEKIKSKIIPNGKSSSNFKLIRNLWQTRNIDARILACMICDPSLISQTEANRWVSVINYYALADFFAELIVKTRYAIDIMYLWIQSPEEHIKRTGFGILNLLAKNDKSRSDLFFNAFILKIKQEIQTSPDRAKEIMSECMVSIGKRNNILKDKVLDAVRSIGNVEYITDKSSKTNTINLEEIIRNN